MWGYGRRCSHSTRQTHLSIFLLMGRDFLITEKEVSTNAPPSWVRIMIILSPCGIHFSLPEVCLGVCTVLANGS